MISTRTRREDVRSFGSLGDAMVAALIAAREAGALSDEEFRLRLDRALLGHGIKPMIFTKAAK